jgi:excisionase family DNA binding protein
MQMLRVREVALELSVHELTVRRWIHDGRLEAVRLGEGRSARYRVPAHSLQEFLRHAEPSDKTAA